MFYFYFYFYFFRVKYFGVLKFRVEIILVSQLKTKADSLETLLTVILQQKLDENTRLIWAKFKQ